MRSASSHGRRRAGRASEEALAGRDFDWPRPTCLAMAARLVDPAHSRAAAYGELLPPLHGPHQGANAALRPGRYRGPPRRTPSTKEVVEDGFAVVRVPGRLEVVGRLPLQGGRRGAQCGRDGGPGPGAGRGFRGRGRAGGRRRHAPRTGPLGHAVAPGRDRRGHGGGLRPGVAPGHAGRAGGRGGGLPRAVAVGAEGWPTPCPGPTPLVPADGLLVVDTARCTWWPTPAACWPRALPAPSAPVPVPRGAGSVPDSWAALS